VEVEWAIEEETKTTGQIWKNYKNMRNKLNVMK
jgi:hypothetical protein